MQTPRTNGWARLASAGAAAALSLTFLTSAGTAAAEVPVEPRSSDPVGGWAAEVWDGSSTSGTTLRDVRAAMNAAAGTAGSLTGQGVGIAMIDTGVAPVPGLPAGQLVNGPDLSFESQDSQLRYLDTYGHGTHLAGIIVANDSATGTMGLAPKAKVTSVKVGTADGSVDVSQIIAAIDWVVANRNHDPANPIRVLNLAYGSGGSPSSLTDPLQYAVEQAWHAGITVVVSAGNDGNGTARLADPAMDPFVIAVGASSTKGTASTADDELAPFTNMSTGTRGVDVLAPGQSVVSLRDDRSRIDEEFPAARVGSTLFRGSGTSQAAAATSAAIALLLQQRPSLTPDQVKRLLMDSGTPLQVGLARDRGLRQVNIGAAIARATPTTTQGWTRGTGTGSLDAARGGNRLVRDGVELIGERSIFGPFASSVWASKSAQRTAWARGEWMGYRMAGDGWTGAGGVDGTGQISGWAAKCVDINRASTTDGTAIQLYDCNNGAAQYWSVRPDGTIRGLGKCLDIPGDQIAGAKAQLWTCDGTASQRWTVTSARELRHVSSNRCLDVKSWGTANGTPLQIYGCNGQENQRWMPPFASRTWAAATWSGTPWTGSGSWSTPGSSERYWSGRSWAGRSWAGRSWAGNTWATGSWAGPSPSGGQADVAGQ